MSDIVAFLDAELNEDEAAALATTPVPEPGRWRTSRDKHAESDMPLQLVQGEEPRDFALDDGEYASTPIIAYSAEWQSEAEGNLRHIARHDPAQVLREVAAKRAILQLHAISSYPERWGDVRHHPDQNWPHADYIGQLTGGTIYSCAICDQAVIEDGDGPLHRLLPACETVLWLATAYADRPGYKAEWRID